MPLSLCTVCTSFIGPICTVQLLSHTTGLRQAHNMTYNNCCSVLKCYDFFSNVHNKTSCRPVKSLSHATKILPCKSALKSKMEVAWKRPKLYFWGGWGAHKKRGGMLVSLRGIKSGFWYHLGCSGQNAIIYGREGLL